MKSLQTESEQLRTEMLLRSRLPTYAARSRQRYVVVHLDNERHAGSFEVDGAGEHGQGRTGNFKFRETEHKGWGALHTNSSMKRDR